jgi:hypothetical protein
MTQMKRRESIAPSVSEDHKPSEAGMAHHTWSILFLSSIFFLSHNGRSITGPLLPALELDLGLSHADSGGLFIFLSSGYVVSL